jgi:hypothetical protein
MTQIIAAAQAGGKNTAILEHIKKDLSKTNPHLHRTRERNDAEFMITWLDEIRKVHPGAIVTLIYLQDTFIGYKFSIVNCEQCKDTGAYIQEGYPQIELLCDCEKGRVLMKLNESKENWIDETWRKSGSWAAGITGND